MGYTHGITPGITWDGMLRTFLGQWSLNSRGFLSTKLGGAATFGKMGGCQTRSCSGHTSLKLIRKKDVDMADMDLYGNTTYQTYHKIERRSTFVHQNLHDGLHKSHCNTAMNGNHSQLPLGPTVSIFREVQGVQPRLHGALVNAHIFIDRSEGVCDALALVQDHLVLGHDSPRKELQVFEWCPISKHEIIRGTSRSNSPEGFLQKCLNMCE